MQTPPPPHVDPRFARVRKAIADLADDPGFTLPEAEQRAKAAVSLVLRSTQEMEILLIRRAEAEGDPWSGHMALPGGRNDPRDESLLHTAIRETLEETGVGLGEGSVLLGPLNPLVPATRRLPPLVIFPFVFGVSEDTTALAANFEVDEVLWTPLSYLGSPEAEGTVDIPLGGISRTFPCLRVGERVIWGLTYRILQGFFRQIQRGSHDILRGAGTSTAGMGGQGTVSSGDLPSGR